MKLKTILIIFILLTSANSIAQSDTTRINLTLENKIEVVKTLTAYPLVLDKVYLQRELLNTSNDLNNILKLELRNREEEIENLNKQIEVFKEEKNLFQTQLRKQKLKSLKVGGIGVLVIAGLLLVN